MNVSVALEYRFTRLPDGSVWTENQYALPFWHRYLDVFDQVRCVARVRDVPRLDGDWRRADGPQVAFDALPYYVGPAQFLARFRSVRRAVRQSTTTADAFVLRVPGNVSDLAYRRLTADGRPFGVEVLGDPYDVFSPGAVHHPLRAFFRWRATRQLRDQCAGACAASYVTQEALQHRYPSSGQAVSASSIELRDEVFMAPPRSYPAPGAPTSLIFVGSLEQYYKGPDLLIRALALAVERGSNLTLTIIGDGRLRPALEKIAAASGCRDRVHFVGQVSGERVFAALDAADVFVLPSRTEGLPRAMVEAMARGLPCIGSTAGGIPELLAADAIVPRGDVAALAQTIREVTGSPARMAAMSRANIQRARAYRSVVLQERRVEFYRRVRAATQAWRDGAAFAAEGCAA